MLPVYWLLLDDKNKQENNCQDDATRSFSSRYFINKSLNILCILIWKQLLGVTFWKNKFEIQFPKQIIFFALYLLP